MTSSVRPEDEVAILDRTERRLRSKRTLALAGELLWQIRLLVAMMRDKTFVMTWKAKSVILGALVYFLLPTDAVPDILPIVGFVDDSVVIGAVIKQLSQEIARYKEHRSWNS
ncbi:MAG: DUF1232 domain-containing protein [Bradyrhizobiaceae bacterium]|nr:DUF1232 domain-containing protein [Bradyrhizobiaceae bacterium]